MKFEAGNVLDSFHETGLAPGYRDDSGRRHLHQIPSRKEQISDKRVDRLRPITVEQLRAMHAPRWLIRDVAQRKSLVLVWGASGSGKTFLVLDAAISVARGRPWFGNRAQRGGVIYIAGEGHLKFRLDAYCEHHEVGSSDLDGLRIIASSLNLLDPGADILALLTALQEAAAGMGDIALVVLDTLNSMMPGGDENSSEDMGRMIEAARKIMGALDCSVILVHHGGKDDARGARGHSSLKAAVDTEIAVKVIDGVRSATVEKQRDGETGLTLNFRLRPVDLGPSCDPDADHDERDGSCVIEPADAPASVPKAKRLPKGSETAFKALREAIDDHGEPMPGTSVLPAGKRAVYVDTWRRQFYVYDSLDADSGDEAAVKRASDARIKRFTRARLALVEAGAVMVVTDRAWIPA